MPLFQLDIQKRLGSEYWTNRYIIKDTTIQEAAGEAATVIAAERAIHWTGVQFDRARVSDFDPTTDLFVFIEISAPGQAAFVGEYLPLFNVLVVDFATAVGRPSRKYLRTPVFESNISNGVFASDWLTQVQTQYCNPLLAMGAFVDVDDQPFVGAAPKLNVGMRQLRRGSKRQTQPVI